MPKKILCKAKVYTYALTETGDIVRKSKSAKNWSHVPPTSVPASCTQALQELQSNTQYAMSNKGGFNWLKAAGLAAGAVGAAVVARKAYTRLTQKEGMQACLDVASVLMDKQSGLSLEEMNSFIDRQLSQHIVQLSATRHKVKGLRELLAVYTSINDIPKDIRRFFTSREFSILIPQPPTSAALPLVCYVSRHQRGVAHLLPALLFIEARLVPNLLMPTVNVTTEEAYANMTLLMIGWIGLYPNTRLWWLENLRAYESPLQVDDLETMTDPRNKNYLLAEKNLKLLVGFIPPIVNWINEVDWAGVPLPDETKPGISFTNQQLILFRIHNYEIKELTFELTKVELKWKTSVTSKVLTSTYIVHYPDVKATISLYPNFTYPFFQMKIMEINIGSPTTESVTDTWSEYISSFAATIGLELAQQAIHDMLERKLNEFFKKLVHVFAGNKKGLSMATDVSAYLKTRHEAKKE